MTVLNQGIGQVTQPRLLTFTFADQSGIGIGSGGVRVVSTYLPTEIATVSIIVTVLTLEALMRCPRFQQRAIDGEVVVTDQILHSSQQHRMLEEVLSNLGI